jgi:hypothetical protein
VVRAVLTNLPLLPSLFLLPPPSLGASPLWMVARRAKFQATEDDLVREVGHEQLLAGPRPSLTVSRPTL